MLIGLAIGSINMFADVFVSNPHASIAAAHTPACKVTAIDKVCTLAHPQSTSRCPCPSAAEWINSNKPTKALRAATACCNWPLHSPLLSRSCWPCQLPSEQTSLAMDRRRQESRHRQANPSPPHHQLQHHPRHLPPLLLRLPALSRRLPSSPSQTCLAWYRGGARWTWR